MTEPDQVPEDELDGARGDAADPDGDPPVVEVPKVADAEPGLPPPRD